MIELDQTPSLKASEAPSTSDLLNEINIIPL